MIGIIRRLGLAVALVAAAVPAIPLSVTVCRLPDRHAPLRLLAGDCESVRCREDPCCPPATPPAPQDREVRPADSCDCCVAVTLGGSESPVAARPNPVRTADLAPPAPRTAVLLPAPRSRTAALPRRAAPPPPDPLPVPLRI